MRTPLARQGQGRPAFSTPRLTGAAAHSPLPALQPSTLSPYSSACTCTPWFSSSRCSAQRSRRCRAGEQRGPGGRAGSDARRPCLRALLCNEWSSQHAGCAIRMCAAAPVSLAKEARLQSICCSACGAPGAPKPSSIGGLAFRSPSLRGYSRRPAAQMASVIVYRSTRFALRSRCLNSCSAARQWRGHAARRQAVGTRRGVCAGAWATLCAAFEPARAPPTWVPWAGTLPTCEESVLQRPAVLRPHARRRCRRSPATHRGAEGAGGLQARQVGQQAHDALQLGGVEAGHLGDLQQAGVSTGEKREGEGLTRRS